MERIAPHITSGRSPFELQAEENIPPASLERYLRWAKRMYLVPKDLRIEGDFFTQSGKRIGKGFGRQWTPETIVVFNDLHCPFHDNRAIEVMNGPSRIKASTNSDHLPNSAAVSGTAH